MFSVEKRPIPKLINNVLSEKGSLKTLKIIDQLADTETENEESDEQLDNNENLTGVDLLKCGRCFLGYPTVKRLAEHMADECTLKASEINYKCSFCPATRKSMQFYITHILLHGPKRFSCSLCSYKEANQLNMK